MQRGNLKCAVLVGAAVCVIGLTTMASAAVRSDINYVTNTLPPNDDGSTGLVDFGFTLNFFGDNYTQGYVNNNGNVTFTGPLSEFTPFNIVSTGTPMLAPFFADVDTSNAGSPVTYGQSLVGSQNSFGVNWLNVDYYDSSPNHTNRNFFQLVIIDRSDINAGDFDFEFNYDKIQWETGEASGGDADGLGGSSARAGWSNGTIAQELAGSGVNGDFLDGGFNALAEHSLNSTETGRYLFSVRNGSVVGPVPEPSGLLIWAMVLALGGFTARRWRQH